MVYEREPDLRQDLFQEIALALWRALPTFRNQCSERTFVYRIAHNRGITNISRTRQPRVGLELALSLSDPAPNPEQAASEAGSQRELQQRISGLPLGLRQVVILALEGLANPEIAEVLGLSVGNVAVQLSRAKKQLTAIGATK